MLEFDFHASDHLCVELRVCLNAISADAARHSELRRIVGSYVESCRRRGDPVDRVILSLTEVVRVAVPRSPVYGENYEHDFYLRIVNQCVDELYGVTSKSFL